MCDEITIGEKTLDTIRELRAALPTAEIIKSPHYIALPPDDSCLCGVDICATLVQAGYDYDHEPGSGRWGVWPDGVTGLREHAGSTAANKGGGTHERRY